MPSPKPLTRLKSILKSKKDVAQKAVEITELAPKLPDEAIDVLDDALAGADPLLQVAIMDAYFEMTRDSYHEEDLISIMDEAAREGDKGEQLYMAARVALGRITGLSMDSLDEWGDGELEVTATAQKRRRARRRGAPKSVTEITVIIHGTWAANGDWWRKGGDFFEYVRKDLKRTDVYGKTDQFKWSGKNRDSSRKKAGSELHKWLKAHPAREVNVFGHSHGANVAMLATHKEGIRMDRLIMLSPPVRSDYYAKWTNVGTAYNIQASFDPVVAIARGGNWFESSYRVNQKRLKAGGHSSSHESKVWRSERLDKFVGIPW